MGLHMDDLHTPTVPSGSSSSAANGVPKERLALTELIAERDRVQSEILSLADVLDSHGVTMNTSLTTFDGYPRDDIDVAQIRTTRARIISLRNDYKGLMDRIEKGLHAHHAATNTSPATATAPPSQRVILGSSSHTDRPFAKVNSIATGSPAEAAGLKIGDCVLRFGIVAWANNEKLGKVAEVVSDNEGRAIPVKVSRHDPLTLAAQELSLQLTPRRDWGGRGMLGCHLLPL